MNEHMRFTDVRNILQKVETIIADADEVRRILQSFLGEETIDIPPEWLRKRLIVWASVHKRGDVIEHEEFKTLTKKIGYDPRGIGGFFTGDNPSIKWIGETKVGLDPWALDEIEKYEDWLDTVDIP